MSVSFTRFALLVLVAIAAGRLEAVSPQHVATDEEVESSKEDPSDPDRGDHAAREASRRTLGAAAPRPNLLIILTDQQRWDAMGFVQASLPGYAEKFKIRTPHLDALAAEGVAFRAAYCASPLCVPSRASIHTGNTAKRTGLASNQLVLPRYYRRMDIFKDRIENLTTLERVLAAEMNYTAEFYGKYHLPWILAKHPTKAGSVFQYDDYSFEKDEFRYQENWSYFFEPYRENVLYLLNRDGVTPPVGPQCNEWTTFGYDPVALDNLYGRPYKKCTGREGGWRIGRDAVAAKYSPSALLGEIGQKALKRLIDASNPFSLTVSFNAPHAPYISPGETMDPYTAKRKQLYVSPSINDTMAFSAYRRRNRLPSNFKWNKPEYIRDWVAAYYGMIEDTDVWVGKLMQVLKDKGQWDNTMIVFTSDHGEMLGAHAMGGKQNLLEEAIRVPLILKLPAGETNRVSRVDEPVSQIDLFSTVLDYLGAPGSADESDGRSLRRHIEGLSYNQNYDESVVVVEYDERYPTSTTQLSGSLGEKPGFSIRRGRYKLIIPRSASSKALDMMYDLERDPGETRNLLARGSTAAASDAVVGKAEHLKALLVEYMKRHDGPGYYSNNQYNNREGRGDVAEVIARRTWRHVDLWLSDAWLAFGRPAQPDPAAAADDYVRNEYLYLGRTTPGSFTVTRLALSGPWAGSFRVDPVSSWPSGTQVVRRGQYRRVQVRFRSSNLVAAGGDDLSRVNATLTVGTTIGTWTVRLGGR